MMVEVKRLSDKIQFMVFSLGRQVDVTTTMAYHRNLVPNVVVSYNEDTTLKKDKLNEPISSSGSLEASTSSKNHAYPKDSKISKITTLNKEPNIFHIGYVYP